MVVLAVMEKFRDCGAHRKGVSSLPIGNAHSGPQSATAAGLCMNEKVPPLEGHSPTSPILGCRVQTADPG